MATLDEYVEILKKDETQAALHRLDGPLPLDWRALRCNETYLIYFVQDSTRTTTWTDPRWPLPEGWVEKRDPKGVSYFVRAPGYATADDHQPTYTDPRGPLARQLLMHTSLPLPKSVSVRVDDRGYIFFADSVTQTTMWTDPRAPLPVTWVQKRIKASRALLASPSQDMPFDTRSHVYISFFQNRNQKNLKTFVDPRIRVPVDSQYLLQTTQVHDQAPRFPYIILVSATTRQPLWHDGRDPLPLGWTAVASPSVARLAVDESDKCQHMIFYYILQSSGLAGTSIVIKTRRDPRLVAEVALMIDDLNRILANPDLLTSMDRSKPICVESDQVDQGHLPTDTLPTILTATSTHLTHVHLAPTSALRSVQTHAALVVTIPRAIAELRDLSTQHESGEVAMQPYNALAPAIEEPSTPCITPEPDTALAASNLFQVALKKQHQNHLSPAPEENDTDVPNSATYPEDGHSMTSKGYLHDQADDTASESFSLDYTHEDYERKDIPDHISELPRSRISTAAKEQRDLPRSRQEGRYTTTSPSTRASSNRLSSVTTAAAQAKRLAASRTGTPSTLTSAAAGSSTNSVSPVPSTRTSMSGLPFGLSVVNSSYETLFEKEAKLDRGAFGMVWRVKRISDGKQFVMKEMDLARADHEQKKIAKQEGQLHSMLNDPYIVKHEKTFVTPTSVYVVMEYCPRGSLWDLIANRRSNFATLGYWTEDQVMWWLVQLIQAVAHIHSLNIVHLDIKPANMLLANDWSIRLCDFGLSVFTTSKKLHIKDTFAGTPAYASPEQMQGQPPDQKTDVWAVGVILYILCTLVPPFGDLTAKAGPVPGKMGADETHQFHALRKRILTASYPPLPEHFSKDLNALLARLLAKKARFRPTMQEVLDMPYIREHIRRQSAAASSGDDTEERL